MGNGNEITKKRKGSDQGQYLSARTPMVLKIMIPEIPFF